MKITLSSMSFFARPKNYGVIDNYISRSAQPQKEDFLWLKENGVTDIINFRTMVAPETDFSEESVVKDLGMNYHNIPSETGNPKDVNVIRFLETVNQIKEKNGKAHIHCKAGADRTGMYAFIYKMLNGIGNLAENKAEWLNFGHHFKFYPNLMDWADSYVKKTLAKKI